jgi:zinc D-Ala-D-Ala carboxypeptidase
VLPPFGGFTDSIRKAPVASKQMAAHSTGRAVDIAVRLLQLALQEGFTGIGIQQTGEGRFLHLDDIQPEDEFHVPRPWIWSY